MLIDFESSRDLRLPPGAAFVVGSGAAGLALAGALEQAGRDVVLLESGPDVVGRAGAPAPEDDRNRGAVTGLPFQLGTGRARAFGGTTWLWHGQCVRLHPLDVAPRSWVPHSGWPVDLTALRPWYERAEAWLDVRQDPRLEEQWRERPRTAPFAWNPDRLEHDWTQYTPLRSLVRRHGAPLRVSARVTVVVNATVARVIVEGDAVAGVEVRSPGGRIQVLPCAQLVLAAGAIENARLLQLSDDEGIGLGDGRESTGRYLQSHPVVMTADVLPRDPRSLAERYVAVRLRGRRLFPKVRLAAQAQEAHGLLNANAVLLHDFDDAAFAASRRLLDAVRRRDPASVRAGDVRRALGAGGPVVRDVYRRLARGLPTAQTAAAVRLQVWLEQEPDPRSRLVLGRELDGLGLRRAVADWRVSDAELRTSRTLTRWVAEDLERLGVATLRELPAMHDDDAWLGTFRDAAHPAGTTRMSRSARDGVVDADLAVHGLRGLWVVGSSVFPVAGYANPTLTIVALALRLASHLARLPPAQGLHPRSSRGTVGGDGATGAAGP